MNIVVVAVDFKPSFGGIAEYTHHLAKYLHMLGENVTILAQSMPGDAEFDAGSLYQIFRFDFRKFKKQGLWGYTKRYRFLSAKIRECKADVLISNALQSELSLGWLLARRYGIPICLFAYGRELNKPRTSISKWVAFRRNLTTNRFLRCTTHVFCISEYTRKLAQDLGVSPASTSLLPPGVEIGQYGEEAKKAEAFRNEKGWQQKNIILTLSRLVERKGIDTVIKCLPFVLERLPNTIYVIAGDGPYLDELEELIKHYQLASSVTLLGSFSDEQKDMLLECADLFVMPNRQLPDGDVEGYGIVFLEANLHEKAVIGGASGGAIDAVVHEETGLLVDPHDVQTLAFAIIRLLQDKSYAHQLGKQGKERILSELTWPHIALRLQSKLSDLIHG